MKVKKFRVRPRLSTVGRILKSLLGTKQLPAGLEETLPLESEQFLSNVIPTAFYQTWTQDEVPAPFHPSLQAAGLNKAVAVSALVATIGSNVEETTSQLLLNGETTRAQVLTALSEESADLSLQFLLRLLSDDAKSDDCLLSETIMVTDPALLAETLPLVEAQQEGVHLDSAGHLTPRFTRVALVAWWPISKKKHAPLTAKKKTV